MRSRILLVVLIATVTAATAVALSAPANARAGEGTALAAAPGGSFTGVSPARLLDTRSGLGAPKGIVVANGQVTLGVAGRGGIPASGVSSVVLNVTVTGPASAGYVTVYPTGAARPTASNLNYRAGQTVANQVVVGLGTGGSVRLFTSARTHLLADVTGYFSTPDTASGHAGLFHPLTPARLADSRTGQGFTTPGSNTTRTLQVTGRGGVPPTNVGAVALNITVAAPTTAGFVTVYPSGQSRPGTSTINFTQRDVRANRTIVALGTDGRIALYNATGTTPIIVDVVGWFSGASAPPGAGGAYYVSMNPVRVVDTRIPSGDLGGALGPRDAGVQTIAARAGVPTGAGDTVPVAVVGNLTAVSPTTSGYLTAFPPGFGKVVDSVPLASDLNFVKGDIVPNMVMTQLHAGLLGVYNSSGTTHTLLDVSGYFALPAPPLTLTRPIPDANDQVLLTMSSNGAYFATSSWASNLVAGDTNDQPDAFRVASNGVVTRVSVGVGGEQADGPTWEAEVSNDGRYVAFVSSATNLVPDDTNEMTDVFVRDTVANTTTRLSVGPGGVQSDGDSYGVTMSNSGTRIAFTSSASTLVEDDTNGEADVFVADVTTGQLTRASVTTAGAEGDGRSTYGIISGGGDHVAFTSFAANLVPMDTNGVDDLFVRDLATNTTTRENVTSSGGQANPDPDLGFSISSLSITDDGRTVAFSSWADNLVPADTNGASDVFIRDRTTGTTSRITAAGGVQADGDNATISGDGSTILFTSTSDALSGLWSDSYGETMYVYRTGTDTSTPIRGYDYLSGPAKVSTDGSRALVGTGIDVDRTGRSDIRTYVLTLP
ncbi:hypothetical protein GA0070609_2664 [Micromonospora echinaurantiaca]|uniref:WD40-like Beta Propeller Repeat n=1 Tax=Micromonospora echinaurantiaca TaxID=47857 RepID=A0A1C5I2G1_9ACTN|nr:hypothetical protein [Micromonospora echinaurantiaca]SCG52448.1 hypothetical protein GA0070609_2664 [Micromonospora echinaurantiaca]